MKLWPWRLRIDPAAITREADRLEAEAARRLPPPRGRERESEREPYRTTAWVERPREIEAS